MGMGMVKWRFTGVVLFFTTTMNFTGGPEGDGLLRLREEGSWNRMNGGTGTGTERGYFAQWLAGLESENSG
jgi:hypothetical protein